MKFMTKSVVFGIANGFFWYMIFFFLYNINLTKLSLSLITYFFIPIGVGLVGGYVSFKLNKNLLFGKMLLSFLISIIISIVSIEVLFYLKGVFGIEFADSNTENLGNGILFIIPKFGDNFSQVLI